MQIDFHHAVTYIVCRLGGFDHQDAATVAYAAQHVDDATAEGPIQFDNGATFNRHSSAHKMLDYRNFEALGSSHCWIAYHFLPGNGGLTAGLEPDGDFVNKLAVWPNSPVAREMLDNCLNNRHKPYALQLLGIGLHVFADTFAHKGFVGINHEINDVVAVEELSDTPLPSWLDKVNGFFGGLWDGVQSRFVSDVPPVGHGAVLSFPDMPCVHWRFTRRNGEVIDRCNYQDYIEAADLMCRFIQRWNGREQTGLPDVDRAKMLGLFRTLMEEDGARRHKRWLRKIARGHFSFGPAKLKYIASGEGSWKRQALGIRRGKAYKYRPEFIQSDWKRFHDALQAHRFAVIHEILPRYGIVAT